MTMAEATNLLVQNAGVGRKKDMERGKMEHRWGEKARITEYVGG